MFIKLNEYELTMILTALKDRKDMYNQQIKKAKKKNIPISETIENTYSDYDLLYNRLNTYLKPAERNKVSNCFIVYSKDNKRRKEFKDINKAKLFAEKENQIYLYEYYIDEEGNSKTIKHKIINGTIIEKNI